MRAADSNVGGWPQTLMRSWLNSTIFDALPEDLQNVIVDTTVISGYGSTLDTSNFTSTDKLYLLSPKEVWNGGSYDSALSSTRQLDYYSNNGVTTSSYAKAVKNNGNMAEKWSLRSARKGYPDQFICVNSSGNVGYVKASTANGVSPAFRIE